MTENKQIEQALKECEENFSTVFRQSPLPLMLTSAKDHRYIEVNEAFERITGWRRDEVIGRTPFDIEIWVDPGQRHDFVKKLLSGDTVRNLEIRVRMKNGELRTALGAADLIEINGEQCVLGVAMLSDLKGALEAEQFEERLSSMARRLIQAHDEDRATIARELHEYIDRLLLVSIDLDRFREIRPVQVGEVSQVMVRARQQIEDVVSDIQTLSYRLHYPKVEYLGLPAAVASFCKELSNQTKLEIDCMSKDIPKELPKEISMCLFNALRQVLESASKYNDSRKFQVSLSVESDEIHLIVRYLGVGFEPNETLEGSGLGLDLVKERLKLVHGELLVESQPEGGIIIHARVPLSRRANPALAVN
jgi:PAS domain S-box-containing protein